MSRWIAAFLFSALLLAGPFCIAQDETPINEEYKKDVLRMLELTGADKMGAQLGTMVGTSVFDKVTENCDEVTDEMRAVVHEEMELIIQEQMTAMMDEFIPLYAKYFSHDEIRAFIEFYESPAGRKAISVLPQLMQEGFQLGQRHSQAMEPEITERMKRRLEEEGFLQEEDAPVTGANE